MTDQDIPEEFAWKVRCARLTHELDESRKEVDRLRALLKYADEAVVAEYRLRMKGTPWHEIRSDAKLLERIKEAMRRPMTAEERFEQRVSFVHSCVAGGMSKDEVREFLK